MIPVFNGERYMAEAIESVLVQTHEPVELIVVDDASCDGSVALAKSYEDVRLIERERNGGVAAARNDGLAAASGDYFGFVDQDDVMVPDRLEHQLAYLSAHPATDAVMGMEEVFVDEGGDPQTGLTVNRIPDEEGCFPVDAYFPPTILARTSDLRRIGGFDETVGFGDDLDLVFRFRDDPSLTLEMRDEIAVRRRFHASNQSRDRQRARQAVALAFKRRIERARADRNQPTDAER
ncbi:glycosyltransferase family A protein [soil metagenome]